MEIKAISKKQLKFVANEDLIITPQIRKLQQKHWNEEKKYLVDKLNRIVG